MGRSLDDIAADERVADMDRLIACVAARKERDERTTTADLAEALDWPVARTKTALAAAAERGLLERVKGAN